MKCDHSQWRKQLACFFVHDQEMDHKSIDNNNGTSGVLVRTTSRDQTLSPPRSHGSDPAFHSLKVAHGLEQLLSQQQPTGSTSTTQHNGDHFPLTDAGDNSVYGTPSHHSRTQESFRLRNSATPANSRKQEGFETQGETIRRPRHMRRRAMNATGRKRTQASQLTWDGDHRSNVQFNVRIPAHVGWRPPLKRPVHRAHRN